ncbi:RNA-guided endonuclease InsQ/TnpB family protein [Saccharopolyspora mangrovi]|uniref:Transposase n=1 Tax=Saccharopolyspora mangrovi TaxID=3082379 RepID=A0ABU6AKK2_9PSEU|nr:transposase [Saccharopolyspora sp. S2-29]MEB3371956.1 transposase [Saccharopolyspora sp. S2-29]
MSAFAVDDQGGVIDNPRFLRRAERKLKRLQRAMSRKQKGSNNRNKARRRLARQHAKVRDARLDWLHKATTTLIRENQAVYVEDLAVSGLARTRLAKSVHDASWGTFRRLLGEKAARYGRDVVVIDRWLPTSQTCSACGRIDGKKPLNVRSWSCPCGAEHDGDVNAARNILAAGRAERLNACGSDVRPLPGQTGLKQEPTETRMPCSRNPPVREGEDVKSECHVCQCQWQLRVGGRDSRPRRPRSRGAVPTLAANTPPSPACSSAQPSPPPSWRTSRDR